MRILFVGDIVGKPGTKLAASLLPGIIGRESVDLTIVNVENSADGIGVSASCLEKLADSGADVFTGGNHSWNGMEGVRELGSNERLLRPHNYPEGPGSGIYRGETPGGVEYAVLNLQGRIFLPPIDCPFQTVDRMLEKLADVPVKVMDFHAEATSEKVAMGWYLNGRVSAVLGTHTHVPTADARVLSKGTAYCTDVGMTGAWESVIGMDREIALERLRTQRPIPMWTASRDPRMGCVLVDCDPSTGQATAIEHRILGPS